MKPRFWLGSVVFLLLFVHGAASNAQTPSSSGYRVVRKFALGGEGGWDYLAIDSQSRRLYVSRSTHVMVIDADSGIVVGDIPNTPGVHGVALVPTVKRGFTSNGRDSSVTVFDLGSLDVLDSIRVGENPDAILYDPASERVFTFNARSRDATAIDAKTGRVAGTVNLGGRPEFAVADGLGRIYVNLEDSSQVATFRSRELNIEARWPLAPGEGPTGMAMDRDHKRLFIGCSNKLLVVMDSDDGRVVATLPIGSGVDGTAFDSQESLVFSSNGDGTLTVIGEDTPDRYRVLDNVITQRGARTLALDPKTHRIFLATAEFGPAPPPTADRPHPRPSIVPGTFALLVVGK
jgi:DNA-binding beta-propeller fold protein YncE